MHGKSMKTKRKPARQPLIIFFKLMLYDIALVGWFGPGLDIPF